jgi:hypothetical protein
VAAEQKFQGGSMVWIENFDAIYVFYNNGRYSRFADTFDGSIDPISDPNIVPPDQSFFQPTYGFGKVWRIQTGVRDALGWATDGPKGEFTGFAPSIQFAEDGTAFIRSFYNIIWQINSNGSWNQLQG